jgi:hypothetical protein
MANHLLTLFRFIALGCAVLLAALTEVPPAELAVFFSLCFSLLIPGLVPGKYRIRAERIAGGLVGILSLWLAINLVLLSKRLNFWDNYFAVIAWLVAAAMSLTATRSEAGPTQTFWKILTVAWFFLGEIIWFGGAYLHNRPGDFYVGAVICLLLLVGGKVWLRLPRPVILAVNTLILLLVFLPLMDLVVRPTTQWDPQPDVAGTDYLYANARKQPAAYAAYWRRYLAQYGRLMREAVIPDPERLLPYLIRTNCDVSFFESQIHINSDGFRGREISRPKGRTFRILVLGESNTFGFTLTPEHRPWPETLEDLIRTRLQPGRPIEVINTGLPHHSLEDNLRRLKKFIPNLQPDLIISYHGWNGFPWLYPALPPIAMKSGPPYRPRPLWLLAECEYRVKLLFFRDRLTTRKIREQPSSADVMENHYANLYRELIALAQTNDIRLAIANYSMAVNSASDPDVVKFYRGTFPSVQPTIQVNEMHSQLVRELARLHPEVCFVDTHPQLDGEHSKFVDLVHFAPEGDLQMGQTFFGSLSNLLREEFAAGRSRSVNP